MDPWTIAAGIGVVVGIIAGVVQIIQFFQDRGDRISREESRRRSKERSYLKDIVRGFDHWESLYADLAADAQIDTPKVRLRSEAAEKYLDIQIGLFRDTVFDPDASETETVDIDDFSDLTLTISESRRVALIGDPGSGKTTTLQRLAHEMALIASRDEDSPLPLLVHLSDYEGTGITDFLQSSFVDLDIRSYFPDRVFLLMDGLNEMEPSLVPEFREWIETNTNLCVVVTCRKLDYIRYILPLKRIDIKPLDVIRIFRFINNYLEAEYRDELFWTLSGSKTSRSWKWYKESFPNGSFFDFWYGEVDDAPSWYVEQYHLKQIQLNLSLTGDLPGMLGVVSNPFLLFVVIQLYARKGSPPANRGRLFDQFVSLLIEQCGRPAAASQPPWIAESIQRRALAKLAYQIQWEQKSTSVEMDWVYSYLDEAFPEYDVRQILYLGASAGLISFDKKFQFTHQLLQEYFAGIILAEEVRNGIPATRFWPGPHWWEVTGWEETAVLLAGTLDDPDDFVTWLIPAQPTLAFRCVKESGAEYSSSTLESLYNPPDDARISPLPRAEWGRKLAKTGDSRPGVGLIEISDPPKREATESSEPLAGRIPDIAWCRIPSGPFIMGGDPEAWNPWKGRTVNIPYDYWIAKYPITYAQFTPFVESGDYTLNIYWTEAGIEWRGNRTAPRYWDDPRFHFPNHPVIGISWYDAYAFSSWLNSRLISTDLYEARCGTNLVARLLTEAEWEKAARYPDGRRFPWGNEYVPGYANIDETDQYREVGPYYLRRTTAVGLYSKGVNPHNNVHDLSGTVWEWCLSKWNSEYHHPEDNRSSGTDDRVLRGGSWSNNESLARCASRHHYPPSDNGDRRGFRLCMSYPVDGG